MIWLLKPLFKSCGRCVVFDPNGYYSFATISIGNCVFIGNDASFSAPDSSIRIGSHVMFGPAVTIIGGNHNTSVIGKYMMDVEEKRPEDDLPVAIDDDVWVGARAVLLKGVRIGRGSVVAAGSVVTRSVEPYSVVAGVPAKLIRWRMSIDEVMVHERVLYPVDARFERAALRAAREGCEL